MHACNLHFTTSSREKLEKLENYVGIFVGEQNCAFLCIFFDKNFCARNLAQISVPKKSHNFLILKSFFAPYYPHRLIQKIREKKTQKLCDFLAQKSCAKFLAQNDQFFFCKKKCIFAHYHK